MMVGGGGNRGLGALDEVREVGKRETVMGKRKVGGGGGGGWERAMRRLGGARSLRNDAASEVYVLILP